MKGYTDLEQSKKLAEILPIESADMFYADLLIDNKHKHIVFPLESYGFKTFEDTKPRESKRLSFIPCWSLTALLDVIPKEVKIKEQKYAPCLFPIADGHWLYKLWYNSNEIIESPIAVWCDNPIDACYEMILKLHEHKIL